MKVSALVAATLGLGLAGALPAQSSGSPLIEHIEIRRVGVFDSAEASNWLFRLANRLHAGTRESVIRPELLVHQGRPFDSAATEESLRNLRSLGLFRDVDMTTIRTDSGLVQRLTTRDAWSTTLGFDLSSTGNQVSYRSEFMETNLLGTGSRLLARYARTPDHTAVGFEVSHPRFIGRRMGVDLFYQGRSDGHEGFAILDDPFRSLASMARTTLTLREFDGRVLQFADGRTEPRDTLQNRMEQAVLEVGRAIRPNPRGYLRVGLIAQLLRNDYAPQSSGSAIPRNVIFTAGPTLALSRAHFTTTTNFQHLEEVEDIDLSSTLTAGALIATTIGGSPRNGIGPFGSFRLGKAIPGGFGILTGRASGLYSSAGLDSGSAVLTATGIFRLGSDRQRLLLRAENGIARNLAPIDQFDLGGGIGPRGFGAHAYTGDRYRFVTAEYRYTIAPEVAHLAGVAVAAFADHGGAWFAGSLPRDGTDAGVGLRFGLTRMADLRAISIDLVRRFASDVREAGWVIVVGKGFNFTLTP